MTADNLVVALAIKGQVVVTDLTLTSRPGYKKRIVDGDVALGAK